MNTEKLLQLTGILQKTASGSATSAEKTFFETWKEQADVQEYGAVLDAYQETLPNTGEQADITLLRKINDRLDDYQSRPEVVTFRKYPKFALAAASLLVFLSAGYLFLHHTPAIRQSAKTANLIKPGGNKAILILANGSTIILDSSRNGKIASQGNLQIRKTKDGLLEYQVGVAAAQDTVGTEVTAYNTITTPNGGEYEVVLPDKSKVWLNSASSLTYPTQFFGTDREVTLTGEAYFEVDKNKEKPFIVKANGTQVKVLGTHFNVMAYADENSVNTTLLEGSVRVIRGKQSRLIVPGQMARVNDLISVGQVNTAHAVAWKNGKFAFSGENIQSIMRKISRWYDVDISYQGTQTQQAFVGTVSKYAQVDEVLKVLELTELVHFKINGRRITVMP